MSSLADRLIDRRPIVGAYAAMLEDGRSPSIGQLETLLRHAQIDAVDHLATLYYDIAPSSGGHELSAISGVVPPQRLLLGTDFPMAQEIGAHVTLTGLDRFTGFTASDRDALRSTNATRLFPRLATPRMEAR